MSGSVTGLNLVSDGGAQAPFEKIGTKEVGHVVDGAPRINADGSVSQEFKRNPLDMQHALNALNRYAYTRRLTHRPRLTTPQLAARGAQASTLKNLAKYNPTARRMLGRYNDVRSAGQARPVAPAGGNRTVTLGKAFVKGALWLASHGAIGGGASKPKPDAKVLDFPRQDAAGWTAGAESEREFRQQPAGRPQMAAGRGRARAHTFG